MAEAQAVVAAEISWRKSAVTRILPGLISYQQETSANIGLRGQERLPDFLVSRISAVVLYIEIYHLTSSLIATPCLCKCKIRHKHGVAQKKLFSRNKIE